MKLICLILCIPLFQGCAALPQMILYAEQAAVEEVVELSIHHKTAEKDTTVNMQLESKEVNKEELKDEK